MVSSKDITATLFTLVFLLLLLHLQHGKTFASFWMFSHRATEYLRQSIFSWWLIARVACRQVTTGQPDICDKATIYDKQIHSPIYQSATYCLFSLTFGTRFGHPLVHRPHFLYDTYVALMLKCLKAVILWVPTTCVAIIIIYVPRSLCGQKDSRHYLTI